VAVKLKVFTHKQYAEHTQHIPSLFGIHIYLLGRNMTSHSDMEIYIKSLAAIYERHWMIVDRDDATPSPFVIVYASVPVPEQYAVAAEPRFGVLQGLLGIERADARLVHHWDNNDEQPIAQIDDHEHAIAQADDPLDNDDELDNDQGFSCVLFEGWGREVNEQALDWEHGHYLEPSWSYPCPNAPHANFWYNVNMVYEEF
jgi:hypothetical protein